MIIVILIVILCRQFDRQYGILEVARVSVACAPGRIPFEMLVPSNAVPRLALLAPLGTLHVSRRSNGEGSIGKRRGGLFEARATIGYDEGGKPVRRSVYAKTRREVAQKLADLIRSRDAGSAPVSTKMTVGDLMERWLSDVVKPYRAPSTYRTHSNYAKNHVYPELGKLRVVDLTIHDLQLFINQKKAAGIHPNTLLHLKNLVSGALTQGMKWGVLDRNVARNIEIGRVPHFKVAPLQWDGARRLLDVSSADLVYGPVIFLAVLTGLREGELLGLTWDKVDFRANTITVEQSLQRANGQWLIGDVKTKSSRATIPVDARALERLEAHRGAQATLPSTPWTQLGLVFLNNKGMPLHAAALGRQLRVHLDAAGLPRVRFHDLRHGFASMLIDNKESVTQVKEAMRHSNSNVTLTIYGHLMDDRQNQAVSRLSDRLFAEDTP